MIYRETLRKHFLAFGLVAAGTAGAAGAGAPYLVADIDQTPLGSDPEAFVELDGRVCFSAFHPASGRELWTSDGTEGGTRLVKDIFLGERSSEPSQPILFAGRLFFSAETESHGRELWASDGTEDGTFLVRDIDPGPGDGNPVSLVPFDGLLFFSAADYGNRELWSSDGTEDGTRMFVDLAPGLVGSGPGSLTVSGDRLFFYAETSGHCREPWVSDGTAEGTAMLADVRPGAFSGFDAFSSTFVGLDGFAYFNASNASFEGGLWFSDGTPEGTRKVDLTAASDPRDPTLLAFVGGRLLFSGRDGRLWALAADGVLEPLGSFRATRFPVTAGDEVFFSAGSELWRSDGTPEGTRLFVGPIPGEASSELRPVAFVDGRLWFTQHGGPWGLWTSDGTPEATVRVRASAFGFPQNPSFENGRLWFVDSDEAHGAEPWSSDGTAGGTRQVRDIDDVRTGNFYIQRLEPLARDRMLIFGPSELWVADGSSPGTVRVPGSEQLVTARFRPLAARLGGRVYFEAESPGGRAGGRGLLPEAR